MLTTIMQPSELLQTIFSQKAVKTPTGEVLPLHSSIDPAEGSFLRTLISQYQPENTLEIGCAYGLSSLYICDGLQKNKIKLQQEGGNYNPKHYIIDPYQKTQWQGVGIHQLQTCGIDFFHLIEKPSELALPELLAQGKQFDFVFIDGWHTLDHTLLDLFYANQLLKVGGVVVVDDVLTIKPVNKAVRYFLNYPAYQFIGKAPYKHSLKRQVYYTVTEFFALLTYLIPLRKKIFNPYWLQSDRNLQVDSPMVAMEKIATDQRSWNWYEEF